MQEADNNRNNISTHYDLLSQQCRKYAIVCVSC